MHRDNVGRRELIRQRLPLVYLHGVVKGKYLAAWPVCILNDDQAGLTVSVAVDDATAAKLSPDDPEAVGEADLRRKYVTATVRQRLHQRTFRERVLAAYSEHRPVRQRWIDRLTERKRFDAPGLIQAESDDP